MTAAVRSKRYRNRKKRGERLVDIRLTEEEIDKLAARGYVVEPGFAACRRGRGVRVRLACPGS